jgi:hypothetical protein
MDTDMGTDMDTDMDITKKKRRRKANEPKLKTKWFNLFSEVNIRLFLRVDYLA